MRRNRPSFDGIRAAEPEEVVRRRVGHDAIEHRLEVVLVEEGAPARVFGHRRERVLRRRHRVEPPRHRGARKRRLAPGARLGGVTGRPERLQPPRVGGVDRDVAAHGVVGHHADGDAVVEAGLGHPAAEVDERLLLLDRRHRVDQRLDGLQPPVGVEQRELGVVGRERGGRVVGGIDSRRFLEPHPLHAAHPIHRLQQQVAVGS